MPPLAFNGRARRWTRASGDALWSLAQSPGPRLALVRCHWWEHAKNFGDMLTPLILPKFGLHPVSAPAQTADLVGIGSLLQHLPPETMATAWGTGLIHDEVTALPDLRTPALRGHLTAERIGARRVEAFGDPGLLLAFLLRPGMVRPRRYRLGVVPHYAHRDDPEFVRLAQGVRRDPDVRIIDVRRHPLAVAARIASCDTIVTSSLHGLITADSLGIPAVSLRGSTELMGGDFKFHDHETAVRPAKDRRLSMADLASFAEAASHAVRADERAVRRAQEGLVRTGHALTRSTAHRLVRGVELPAALVSAARTELR